MPVDFLTAEQERRYGRYAMEPAAADLARCFYLDDYDRALIAQRRGDHNRLGFALQLCTVRYLGTFLADPVAVPASVITRIAAQLGTADTSCLLLYGQRAPTQREHAGEIQRVYGYRDFHDPLASVGLLRWLMARAWVSAETPSVLFDLTTARLVERKILLPGVTTLTRLIARVRDRVSTRLWARLAALPDAAQRARLERLAQVAEGERVTPLEVLRRAPTHATAAGLVGALRRLRAIRELGVSALDLGTIPPSRITVLARHAATVWAASIARMPPDRQVATLLAFARVYEARAQDDALDVLDTVISTLFARVERAGDQARLRTLRDLDAAALVLREAVRLLRDPAIPPAEIRTIAEERIGGTELDLAITVVGDLTRPPDDHYYDDVLTRYSMVRQFLPSLLRTITFEGTAASAPVRAAVAFLREIEDQKKPEMLDAPLEAVPPAWRRLVVQTSPTYRIDRRGYTFAVLEQLQPALKRHDVFVAPSEKWGDARAKLLQGAAWEAARPQVCHSLDRSTDPSVELETLRQQLDGRYRRTAENLASNPFVRLAQEKGRDTLVITPLDRLAEPESLKALRAEVARRLPRVDLPDAILEVQRWTGFLDDFTHISESTARVDDLVTSLCAVLVAEACNIGLEPVVRRDRPAQTRDRLQWIKQNYVRNETILRANARLVAAQAQIPLAQAWGGGEVASADGLRFKVPVRTIHAGSNPRYFHHGAGATYFNFTSDQFSGLHYIVIPGTLKEGPYLLAGLLEQQTSLQPREIMTDTASYSDQLFGLFWLLGYQFSPRLADAGGARLWRLDPTADYGPLNDVSRHRINTRLITQHWDDLLRVAGSLKMHAVGAVELMQALQGGSRASSLARAIAEVGRIAKSLYLLDYYDDESYRRRILTQLTRGERRHNLARAVFHGRKGELRQRYREGQEDQLGVLGLVMNVLVLWTTQYMDLALTQLRAQGYAINEEDLARLSPLGYKHIHLLGRYHVALAEVVARGEFRPLRDGTEPEDDEDYAA